MAYDKEHWLSEAQRLGVQDAESLSWQELQSQVKAAQRREQYGLLDRENTANKLYQEVAQETYEPLNIVDQDGDKEVFDVTESTKVKEEETLKPKKATGLKGRLKKMLSKEETDLKKFRGIELKIAPEIYPNDQRAVHYKEELGDELILDEKHYDIRGLEFDAGTNIDSGTYIIRGKTGERVVATSAIPKEQPGLFFRPDMDYAVVVVFMGRAGYLWTHHRLPNIKALLQESGYYEEYKKMFKDDPNIWYSAGLLVCDPSVVHHVFQEIEEKERIKRERGY